MARVKLSGLVTDINGSINGTTFQNSLGGLSIKSKSIKRKSVSVQANDINRVIATVTQMWRSLTQGDRDTWNSYANFYNVSQNHNVGRFLNGQQLYIKYQVPYYSQFGTIFSLPVFDTYSLLDIVVTIVSDGGTPYVRLNSSIDESEFFLIFKISHMLNSSVKRAAGGTKQIILTFGGNSEFDFNVEYGQLYGSALPSGAYVFIEYQLFSSQNPLFGVKSALKVLVENY